MLMFSIEAESSQLKHTLTSREDRTLVLSGSSSFKNALVNTYNDKNILILTAF
jgi:hypothetical protein